MVRPQILILFYTLVSASLGILLHPLYFLMLFVTFISVVVDGMVSDFRYASTCPFGFFRKFKRVYTSDGIFYIYFRHDHKTCHLFQDKIFFLKGISYSNYVSNSDGEINIEPIKTWVKSQVDSIYSRKRYNRRLSDSVTQWNGHIDKQVERDVKINEVLK